MEKKRYYLDTSVWGGVASGRADFRAATELFFDMVKGGWVVCLYSKVVGDELEDAPKKVRSHFKRFPAHQKERLIITQDILDLAKTYMDEGVVGESNIKDCLHIAAATVYNADMLVSWNFKHIVGVKRIKGYNNINVRLGYKILNIKSPKEVLDIERGGLMVMEPSVDVYEVEVDEDEEDTFDYDNFDPVEFFRKIREERSLKLCKLSDEEILEYYENGRRVFAEKGVFF